MARYYDTITPEQAELLARAPLFFVASADPQPVGARLEISFSLPGDHSGKLITAEAMVVRRSDRDPKGFACRFFQISTSARLYVEEFLDRMGAKATA